MRTHSAAAKNSLSPPEYGMVLYKANSEERKPCRIVRKRKGQRDIRHMKMTGRNGMRAERKTIDKRT